MSNAAWRRWYCRNAARKIGWQARRRDEMRVWWVALKSMMAHVDPTTKAITLADAISRGWSKQRILDEVAKCRVLCANCHLKHHWSL